MKLNKIFSNHKIIVPFEIVVKSCVRRFQVHFSLIFYFRFLFFLSPVFWWAVVRDVNISYETSPRGNPILVLNYNRYVRNRESKKRIFWRCTKYYQNQISCPGSVAITKPDDSGMVSINTTRPHNELCEIRREQDEQRSLSRAPRDPLEK